MKSEILKMLSISSEEYISGEKISGKFGISRAAIWKYINALKEEGYVIESSPKKGYKLLSRPDILTKDEILPFLSTQYIGQNILYYETINSTNLKAKELDLDTLADGSVIVSEEQTAGRGRLGRRWVSPKGKGIWMTIVLKPQIEPNEAYKITVIGAAAVYLALREFNVEAQIKWPNDIIVNGKKVCGILTEMGAELSKINYLIIGLGLNVNFDLEDLPDALKDTATSLKIEFGRSFDRKRLMPAILNFFEILYNKFIFTGSIDQSVEICRDHSAVLNKEIYLIKGSKQILVKALDISKDGHLLVQDGDEIYEVYSGEISLRTLNGYI